MYRTHVNYLLENSLKTYYPVVFVDCVHIRIHRNHSVSYEVFYVTMVVTNEEIRDVISIFCMPVNTVSRYDAFFITRSSKFYKEIKK